nr:unnamed protein product [Callosobruchus analis]
MIIYKRKHMAIELKTGAPPGAIVTTSDTGYINSKLFLAWLRHFIETVKPSQQKKSFVTARWPHNAFKKPECYIISERTWCCTAPATWSYYQQVAAFGCESL